MLGEKLKNKIGKTSKNCFWTRLRRMINIFKAIVIRGSREPPKKDTVVNRGGGLSAATLCANAQNLFGCTKTALRQKPRGCFSFAFYAISNVPPLLICGSCEWIPQRAVKVTLCSVFTSSVKVSVWSASSFLCR